MKLLKEKTEATTRAITTLFIGSALLVGFMAMMSMPQMIGSANAVSEQGSAHACKIEGFTLSQGQCTAEPKQTVTCETIGGVTPTPSGTTCTAVSKDIKEPACKALEGSFKGLPGGNKQCVFPATVTITCPGGVTPTEEGECIIKPGNRADAEEEA